MDRVRIKKDLRVGPGIYLMKFLKFQEGLTRKSISLLMRKANSKILKKEKEGKQVRHAFSKKRSI